MKWPLQEAVWFTRRRQAVKARETEDAFQTWLIADPENELRFGQCELMWERIGDLAPDEDVRSWLNELDAPAALKPRRHTLLWAGWAVAASLALVALGLVGFQMLRAPVYQTAVGEQRDVQLPDGSRIMLNTATRVVVRYGKHARRIELESGEAAFAVRKDPARPFEVIAGLGTARALGTRFAVARGKEGVTVSVLEGIVEVVGHDASAARHTNASAGRERAVIPVLETGQAVSVTNDGSVTRVATADLRRIRAWQDRKLDFDAEPLDKAIAEVNRYATRRLTMGTPDLATVRVSGVFQIAELDGFTFALQESFGLRVVENGDELVLLPPASSSAAIR